MTDTIGSTLNTGLSEVTPNYLLRCSRVTSVAKIFLFTANSGPFFSEYQIDFLKNSGSGKDYAKLTLIR